jgi:G3E family GTPase
LDGSKYMIDGYVDRHDHYPREIDLIQLESAADESIAREKLNEVLEMCSQDEVYRIKGFIRIEGEGMCILNFAFGRWEITTLTRSIRDAERGLRLTVMLARGEGRQWQKQFPRLFAAQNVHIDYHPA